jgi:hypothetical protein
MANTMFMGTREVMLEVPCPNVTMPSGKNGWTAVTDFLNGGSSVRRSTAASKRYEMTWNSISRDEARTVLDLADRIYGTGEIYWLDPFTADKNVLPQHWASPMQGIYDGLPLIGLDRPEPAVGAPTYGFPVQGAQYSIDPGDAARNIWVPIPTGYSAHIGIYGYDVSGGQVLVTPTINAALDATPQAVTLMDADDTSRANMIVRASDGYNGIKLNLGGTGSLVIFGMMVQILKDGNTPVPGGFISGQGNSGCQFAAQPEYTPYSAAFDNVGMIASFIETGSWEQ